MKVTIISDNVSCDPSLKSEWGLSFFIEFGGKKFLLDTGGSDNYFGNASKLGLDISDVDFAILSHAHYDHSLGMASFFINNCKSDFYISKRAGENCYAGWRFISRYIGVPKGVISTNSGRIKRIGCITEIYENVYIVPHSTSGLDIIGKRSHMYVREGLRYRPDDYSHEQTLVFRTDSGLVIFNSCSHAGADIIVNEVKDAFPGEIITAYFGGLHLFRLNDNEINLIADKISASGLTKIYTGHCTGDHPFCLLREKLGSALEKFCCGMQITI